MIEGEYVTDAGRVRLEKYFAFLHKAEDKRLVYGVVYEPNEVDLQDEFTDAIEIEKAAHGWMQDYQILSNEHGNPTTMVRVVESYVAPQDLSIGGKKVKKGAWIVVAKVLDDDMWEKVKKGELTGFSMGGTKKIAA